MNFNEFVLLLHFFISHAQIDTETMNIMIHHIFSRILLIGSSWGPKAVGGAAHLACFFTNPSSGLLNFRHDFRRTSSYIRTTPLAIFLLFDLPTRRQGVSIAPLPIKCKVDITEASYDALCIRCAIAV